MVCALFCFALFCFDDKSVSGHKFRCDGYAGDAHCLYTVCVCVCVCELARQYYRGPKRLNRPRNRGPKSPSEVQSRSSLAACSDAVNRHTASVLSMAVCVCVCSTLLCLLYQETQCLVALATVLQHNQSLKRLNVSRPVLFSVEEETTDHFARALKVSDTQRLISSGYTSLMQRYGISFSQQTEDRAFCPVVQQL